MFSILKRFFGGSERSSQPEPELPSGDDDDLSWLNPPADPLDTAAWNHYWAEHLRNGIGPPLFDMFSSDHELVNTMIQEGMHRVLCAGSGISQEPKALAQAGFEVVALDLSPEALEIARQFEFPYEALAFFCDPALRREGGRVDYVVGNILDSAVCPGPFDVIIERRTAQLYEEDDMGAVLEALAGRLSPNGIFLSHCHDGPWHPPDEPRHSPRPWFQKNGWTTWDGTPERKPTGRVAWLFTSTG